MNHICSSVRRATVSFSNAYIFKHMPVLTPATPLLVTPCCGKKTKAGGTTKNKRGRTPGKFRGPVHQDGAFVYKGNVLHKQLGLKIYPGENVGIQKNNSLYAQRDGIVMVTCEKLNPYPDSPLYQRVQDGVVIYKKFYNVYPTPVHAKFKLVSQT